MKLNIQKYLEISTIHGLFYTSKRHQSVERIFWALTLTSSVICTLVLIVQLAIKMKSFPIVTYLSDTSVPVSDIYFPAVTICPDFLPFLPSMGNYYFRRKKQYHRFEKHTGKVYYYEHAEYLNETIDERKTPMNYLSVLKWIKNGIINPKKLGLKILKRLQVLDMITKQGVFSKLNFSIPTDDFLDVINEFDKEFLISYEMITFAFIFEGSQYVSEIITPHGLCFSFNMAYSYDMLNYNSTSSDFYYQIFPVGLSLGNPPAIPEFPRKDSPFPYGLKTSLLISNNRFKSAIRKDYEGYDFILHDPFELPSSSSNRYVLKSDRNVEIKIMAQINTIDDSIAHYQPKERNCYLETERKLKFFKTYTKLNCVQECLTDFMISRCRCVEFFMVRNLTTRICSASEKSCYDLAQEEFENHKHLCECLQPCNYVKYEYLAVEKSFQHPIPGSIVLSTSIEFGEVKYNPLVKKQQFNEIDFFSYFGGLLGLFAGISVLSIVETVYWFTIQLFEEKFIRSSTKVVPFTKFVANNNNEFIRIKDFVVKFFNESSIHGLGYIVGPNFIQRFVWMIITIFSMTGCFYMISKTGEIIPDSRVVAYDDQYKHVENMKFPAITIVPGFSYKTSIGRKLTLFTRNATNLARKGIKLIPTKEILRDSVTVNFCSYNLEVTFGNKSYNTQTQTISVIKEHSKIKWFQDQMFSLNGKYHPVFAEIPTQLGMGFTFNLLDADKLLNFDSKMDEYRYFKNVTANTAENSSERVYNIRLSKGNRALFSMSMKKEKLFNETVCYPVGLLIHSDDEMPRFVHRQKYSLFQYGMDINIELTPEIIKTDEDLRSLNPKDRECYFEGEKALKFFKKYSKLNCVIECMADQAFKYCGGCSNDLWKPVEDENYCFTRRKSYRCHDEFMINFMKFDAPTENCSCLPTCDSEIFHVKYFYSFAQNSDELTVNIRVNPEDAILFRRYQQYTFSDVVSYVGGLLGLFAGISVLSIVEIVYFFTIRVFVNIFRIFTNYLS